MVLTPGTRVGPYEITGSLGAGGMGEVYKARDTRLDRIVAIKVLNSVIALDPTFRARFDREARAISALNHPYICTLHDVGTDGDTAYLVMEHVEGEPLAGPMAPMQAVQIAIRVCEALEAAHRAGIVHRDLKPSNILRTKTGVKLLDFGLATRATAAVAPGTADATMTGALTGAHTIVGTPQYMSPEQIEGRDADARSDIFAFGCVLYELVTGTKAFDGTSPSHVMAAILASEPRPMRGLTPIAPASLEWVVARCLKKDPEERWQTVRDLRAALERVRDEVPAGTASAGRTGSSWLRAALLVLAGAAIAATITALILLRPAPPSATAGILRADINLAAPLAPEPQGSTVALSRDGRVLAYVTGVLPNTTIFVRRLDDRDATPRPVAHGGSGPFFSPDGRWIAFGDLLRGKLFKASAAGDGAPIAVADAPGFRGGVWLDDDTIVFSPNVGGPLVRVSAGGGVAAPITVLNAARDDKTHRYPDVLPDGRHLLFTAGNRDITSYEDGSIVLQSLDGGPDKVLVQQGMFGRYVTTGHILYTRGGAVYAVPFDAAKLQVTGAAVPVLSDAQTHPIYGYADLDVSRNGVLVYAQGGPRTDDRHMVWIDRRGVRKDVLSRLAPYGSGRLSPDGHRMLVEISAANNAIWLVDLDRDVLTRVTFHRDAYFGRWTRDGKRVTYMSGYSIRETTVDGSGREEVLVDSGDRVVRPSDWSPDGRTLAFEQFNPGQRGDIMLFDRSTRRITPFLATPYTETAAQFSPDGRWLAYLSDESGRMELNLRPFGREGGRWQVSPKGAEQFAWNPRGGEIVFRQGQTFFAIPVTLGETPSLGVPVKLFDADQSSGNVAAFGFGISLDGQRVLLREAAPAAPVLRLAIVANWFDDLRRATSAGR